MCKKTCHRATLAETTNQDYLSTCISSINTPQNIYSYCSYKMKDHDQSLMVYCKLDMCNLCCVTMDPIKKKIYSLDNMKKCFSDCSRGNKFIDF